ncbi:MAG: hypothetical protein R3E39_16295 [Anaerolineae bacterium]
MRFIKIGLLVLVLAAVGVAAVSANFDDGRVNHWEAGAPVAVYCKYTDEERQVFAGIEVLRINAENNGTLVLDASAAQIATVDSTPATHILILSENGYTLYRLTSGDFQLLAPADSEGKVYSFTWGRDSLNC